MNDNFKQFTALIGGALGALFLFFGTVGVSFEWFTPESIDAFVVLFGAVGALGFSLYGVYKNSYKLTRKARKQDAELKRKGLK